MSFGNNSSPSPKGFVISCGGSDFQLPEERKKIVERNKFWAQMMIDRLKGGVCAGKDIPDGRGKNAEGNNHQWAKNLGKGGWSVVPFFDTGSSFWGRNVWDWLKKPKYHFCDLIDRLNCSFAPAMLLFFLALVSVNILGLANSQPMHCLESNDLKGPEFDYALEICQTKNLYSAIPDGGIPWSKQERRRREIGYYHWVPLTLILQAILFYVPNWIWIRLNRSYGVTFATIIRDAREVQFGTETEMVQKFNILSDTIREAVMNRLSRRLRRWRFGESFGAGAFITLLYIGIKCLYLANVAGQFYLLNFFLGSGYRFWGFEVLRALNNGEKWQESSIFPRQTLCDVEIHRLGDTPRYTLQCHLRINAYNEKVYLFIWWFFLAIACATALNILFYLRMFLPGMRLHAVRSLLQHLPYEEFQKRLDSRDKEHTRVLKRFAHESLNYDGVLLFLFIADHAGKPVASHLMAPLFETFLVDNELIELETVNGTEKRGHSSPKTESINNMNKTNQQVSNPPSYSSSAVDFEKNYDEKDTENGMAVKPFFYFHMQKFKYKNFYFYTKMSVPNTTAPEIEEKAPTSVQDVYTQTELEHQHKLFDPHTIIQIDGAEENQGTAVVGPPSSNNSDQKKAGNPAPSHLTLAVSQQLKSMGRWAFRRIMNRGIIYGRFY